MGGGGWEGRKGGKGAKGEGGQGGKGGGGRGGEWDTQLLRKFQTCIFFRCAGYIELYEKVREKQAFIWEFSIVFSSFGDNLGES